MKKSQSIMSKYSDKSMKKKGSSKVTAEDLPPMADYEQRYKGMSKELTQEPPKQTLNDKIKKRESLKKPVNEEGGASKKVSVEINGNLYLLGCTEDISEARIRKIAALTNEILNTTKENNPGLTNSKINALALIDACDRILTLKDENSNMRTELMYLQQKVMLEEEKEKSEPTPMELLANE
ncbi:MAG: cell division protein ZapA [Clostridiales bacterium]|nr:cell division protein ZapA [Clostridiales bacterium]